LLLLATHTAGSPYAGWWAGLVLGFIVVVVVVLVVAFILTYASRIGERTQDALEVFDAAATGTAPLARLHDTRMIAQEVLTALRAARDALPGART
jgi:hypothetical protein